MKIRRATDADEPILRELWEEFEREVPEPVGDPEPWEDEWRDTLDDIRGGGVFLAEDDEGPLGVARIEAPERGRSHVQLVHVRERARRQGVAKALLQQCVANARERGARFVSLDVLSTNTVALNAWRRLGFEEHAVFMATPIDRLAERLEQRDDGEFRATTHVQSDDTVSVDRTLAQFIPRLDSADVSSSGSWIRIAHAVLDRDRSLHARLARELSDRLGAIVVALAQEGVVARFQLWENGRMVDEYLSVPAFYGELPKGDELALEANPTLVARLTGADRDDVRRVARTAMSPADLPPADELYEELAHLMGLEP
jgi:ribosomal protein S18 acetylase RimI-like enzyme